MHARLSEFVKVTEGLVLLVCLCCLLITLYDNSYDIFDSIK